MDLENVKVGDKLIISLLKYGDQTATAQLVTDDEILYLFDKSLVVGMMNERWDNEGGYEKTDLKQWIKRFLFPLFSPDIQQKMYDLTIPTYGQIFEKDSWYYDYVEPDDQEQLPLMVDKRYRAARIDEGDSYFNYWLQNPTKSIVSNSAFIHVTCLGTPSFGNPSAFYGIRPIFRIKK